MHIAFCTDGIYPYETGGMQKHSRLLIEALAPFDDLQITVLHPHNENVFNSPRIKEIKLAPIDTTKNYLLETYRYSRRVEACLKEINPDIIYSQGLSVWSGIHQFSRRLIINPHGLEPYQAIGWKNKLLAIPFRWIFNYLFSHAAKVVSLGGRLSVILKQQCSTPDKIVVLPNAINLPADSADLVRKPDLPIKVLFLARFATNKGIDILFQAIDQLALKNQLHKFEFRLGGKGPLYEQYRSLSKPANVELLGFVKDEDINRLYKEHDLFVLPTLFEGMPTVVLEAMGWKMPIIVSDVGATAELVDTNNGYLIPPGSVDALVNALLKFEADSISRKLSMGEASRKRVSEQFNWNTVALQHRELFYALNS
jgi:glycosyltransferase involved in cell wall biosynthesis